MSYRKLIAIGIGLLLGGMILGQLPSLYRDLQFLHAARVFNEQQAAEIQARQAAAQQKPQGVPSQEIQQSQVHPGIVPPTAPTASPPEKK